MHTLIFTIVIFTIIMIVMMLIILFMFLFINLLKSTNITEIQRDEQGRITSIINKQI